MKNRFIAIICILALILWMCGCTKNSQSSHFCIVFLDVGQGDSALVECDGHYMLVDGGDVQAGDKVYRALVEREIQALDILAISHLHEDHYGGLSRALMYISSIGVTISNSSQANSDQFAKLEHQLSTIGSNITIPDVGKKYKLGSADVEVVDATANEANDSLVLLVTYGKTRFLFTGDIQYSGQKRIVEKYAHGFDKEFKVDVIKMPHHGSWGPGGSNDNDLNRLMRTFNPDYAVISVGTGNQYGHPHKETLELLDQAEVKVYRTDQNGDITVQSNGKELLFETSK